MFSLFLDLKRSLLMGIIPWVLKGRSTVLFINSTQLLVIYIQMTTHAWQCGNLLRILLSTNCYLVLKNKLKLHIRINDSNCWPFY